LTFNGLDGVISQKIELFLQEGMLQYNIHRTFYRKECCSRVFTELFLQEGMLQVSLYRTLSTGRNAAVQFLQNFLQEGMLQYNLYRTFYRKEMLH
jgi:hypothetical protein